MKKILVIMSSACISLFMILSVLSVYNMVMNKFFAPEETLTVYSSSNSNDDTDESVEVINSTYITSLTSDEIADMFTDRDLENDYDESSATYIDLDGDTVTISEEGVYILSGSISDGQVIVEASDSDKIQLVLDGVSINSDSSAAIYVKEADKVFITLSSDSSNILSTSGEYVAIDDNNIDAVIYSKSDITFNGTGSLTINATYGHGIVGKDDVVFASGTYTISAENHGVNANDSIRINDATFTIDSGKDGMQCENEEDYSKGYIYIANGIFSITSNSDCINASSLLYIEDGTFNLESGGGYTGVLNSITVGEGSGNTTMVTETLEYGMKCFKAHTMIFNDGAFNLDSYEDTIHANGDLTINGGTFTILTGDDGIHADDLLTINDGTIEIVYGYEGIEGDDITINGGTISVTVLDDGINVGSSSGVLTINGGDIYVACQGDGLDSNGDFEMTGGYVVLDVDAIYTAGDSEVDVSGTVSYTGGTLCDENGDEVSTSGSTSSSQRSFGRP